MRCGAKKWVSQKQYFPALRRTKIRQIKFHDLRHTNVALRIEQGQNIKYIQNQLGHASIQTTLDRYGHLIIDVNTEQAKKLDSILGFYCEAELGTTLPSDSAVFLHE